MNGMSLNPGLPLTGLLLIAGLLGTPGKAGAHAQSTAFLNLKAENSIVKGDWHISLRDLEDAVGIDFNDDGVITWEELRDRKDAVCAYAVSRLHVRADASDHQIRVIDLLVDQHADGAYAVIRF